MNRRRWWLIGGGAAALVVIATGLWIWQSTSRAPTPQEAAIGYLRALESGDPAAVEATGVDVSAAALEAFTAATDLLEDSEIVSFDGGNDGERIATAEISFRLGEEDHTAMLSLVLDEQGWAVDASGLGTMTATTTIGSFVSIGEEAWPAGQETALLPAAYAVTTAPSALLAGQTPLVVLPGADSAVAVEASLRPEATIAAQERLDDHLASCTAPGSASPEGCGIRIPWGTEFRTASEFRYRVEQLPTLTLESSGFTADGGVLLATITGIGQDGSDRTTTYRTESWSLRGDVSFTATDVVLSAW